MLDSYSEPHQTICATKPVTTVSGLTGHSATAVAEFGANTVGFAEGVSGYLFESDTGGGARGVTLQIGGVSDVTDAISIAINGVDVNLADMIASGEATILTGTDRPATFQSYDSVQDLSINGDGDIVADQAGTGSGAAQEEIIFISFRDAISALGITNNDPNANDNTIFTDIYINSAVTYFGAGTLISTPDGQREIKTLRAGDLAQTRDGRSLPIRWIGFREIDGAEMQINSAIASGVYCKRRFGRRFATPRIKPVSPASRFGLVEYSKTNVRMRGCFCGGSQA